MKCTIIGSGTGIPSVRRSSPCILVETDSMKILLDTGPGSLRQLLNVGITINDIDLVVYSHFHIDHTADMIPFIFACKYDSDEFRTKDLTIIGHTGIKKLYEDLIKAYGKWIIPEHFKVVFIEVETDSVACNGITVKTMPVKHIQSSIAVRLEDGQGTAIVYSGDTDYCQNIITMAHNADLFICECSFPEGLKCPGHLVPSLAGKIATESQCKKLVLTHFYPACEGCDLLTPLRAQYAGEVILADDLTDITI